MFWVFLLSPCLSDLYGLFCERARVNALQQNKSTRVPPRRGDVMCPLLACSYSGHVARRVQQAEILQQIAVWERAGAPTLSGPQPESSAAAAACERLRSPLSESAGLLSGIGSDRLGEEQKHGGQSHTARPQCAITLLTG
ncbi:hypothetical protein MHYP_G00068930 [Metynnis hypsauchen]